MVSKYKSEKREIDDENSQILNHSNIVKMIKNEMKKLTMVNKNKITRQYKEIVNKYEEKIYRFGYVKCAGKSTYWFNKAHKGFYYP